MNIYHAVHPDHARAFSTSQLREHFLLDNLFSSPGVNLNYTLYDRMIVGGVLLEAGQGLPLPNPEKLKASYFLERRELGAFVIEGQVTIEADGTTFDLSKDDCLYLGREVKDVIFRSQANARIYLLSCPAHTQYPAKLIKHSEIGPVELGQAENANKRSIYKYIHLDGARSCQLVMGMTRLATGSVWNTYPPHTHDRRMEVYLYYDLGQEKACHFLGEPSETRHLFLSDGQAALSPPWSIHAGVGTGSYSFIWGMAGENQDYADMDKFDLSELR